jgi:hypothetical protein
VERSNPTARQGRVSFLIGVFVGATVGLVVASIMVAAADH